MNGRAHSAYAWLLLVMAVDAAPDLAVRRGVRENAGMSVSTEVTWQLDDVSMSGTLVIPDGARPFPAVVLVAGSGPTDRDWNSPLLPGTNGSGRLIADALAEAGFASLRYDKRASGPHVVENLPTFIGRISMGFHLDELVAAVAVLADQASVDASRVVGFGNSEGCLHVLHYAVGERRIPFVGLVLAAPPGRAVGEVVRTQLDAQLDLVPDGAELLPVLHEALARYESGAPMDPDPRLPEQLRAVLASFEAPANLPFARELWEEDAADTLARVTEPTLVIIGEKDLQVDVRLDGEPLQRAASGNDHVTFVFPPDANHVLKEEVRPRSEVARSPGTGYNQDGTRLDPGTLAVVVDWLRTTVGDVRGSTGRLDL